MTARQTIRNDILGESYMFHKSDFDAAVEFAKKNGMTVICWDYPNYLVIPADAVEIMSVEYDIAYQPE